MLDTAIIGAYLAGILALGLWMGRGQKSIEEYSVVSRSYSSWIIFATLSASFIGGGFSTGNASKVFQFGIANIVALWGFSAKEILVATYIAPRMNRFPNAISVGDIMQESYGKAGKITAGLFGLVLCAGILGAQVGAIGDVFEVFFKMPRLIGIFIGCGIVIAYTTAGGMRAIVWTDVIQFCILTIGLPITLVLGIKAAGGWTALRASVPADHFQLFAHKTPIALLSLFLVLMFGETLVPPYVQRLFLGKTVKETGRGTLYSGLFSIPYFAITGALGLVALSLSPDLQPDHAMFTVVRDVLPIGLKGLVIAGILSIIMSSADSFLNSGAIALVHDVIEPMAPGRYNDSQKLLFSRLATLLIGMIAIVFALKIRNILDILLKAYEFWTPVILVPLAAVMLGFRCSRIAFIAGACTGFVGDLLWNGPLDKPFGIDGLLIGMFCNLLVFGIAAKLTVPDRDVT